MRRCLEAPAHPFAEVDEALPSSLRRLVVERLARELGRHLVVRGDGGARVAPEPQAPSDLLDASRRPRADVRGEVAGLLRERAGDLVWAAGQRPGEARKLEPLPERQRHLVARRRRSARVLDVLAVAPQKL